MANVVRWDNPILWCVYNLVIRRPHQNVEADSCLVWCRDENVVAGKANENKYSDETGRLKAGPPLEEVRPQYQNNCEPSKGRRPEVGSQGKSRDASQTPTNVADIRNQTVRRFIEGASHH